MLALAGAAVGYLAGAARAPERSAAPASTAGGSSTQDTAPALAPLAQPGADGEDDWRPARAAWTAVVRALPKAQSTQDDARRIARSLGASDAGVLDSSAHRGFAPGYWIVFAGRYAMRAKAVARAQLLRSDGFGPAHAQHVSG